MRPVLRSVRSSAFGRGTIVGFCSLPFLPFVFAAVDMEVEGAGAAPFEPSFAFFLPLIVPLGCKGVPPSLAQPLSSDVDACGLEDTCIVFRFTERFFNR